MKRSRSVVVIVILTVAIVLAVVGGIWYYQMGRSPNNAASLSSGQSSQSDTASSTDNSNASNTSNSGIGGASDLTYQNSNIGLTFQYPHGWHAVDDGLGVNGGTLDLFNYDETQASGSVFPPGRNKIELMVVNTPIVATSSDYPEQSRAVANVKVAGQNATKTDSIFIGDDEVISYAISIPSQPGSYLDVTIFGDPKNFLILDSVVQSIKWAK